MANPNSPTPEDGRDEVDDFFTPEEEQFAETLEQEQTKMQTADTAAAAMTQVLQPEESPILESPDASNDVATPSEVGDVPPAIVAPSKASEGLRVPRAEEQPTPLSKIPITLHVEISRLSLSLQKLFDLKPGAVVPLGQDLEGLVDLVIEGKKVGQARLLRIGEVLGLRIEQLD